MTEPAALAQTAADWIVRVLADTIAARGHATLALAGGRTPEPVYRALAAPPVRERVEWPRVEFYFGDERAVPPDDPASNYRLAYRTLFEHLPADPARIHRMPAELRDLEAAAEAYARLLPPQLDLLLLGMGADGHTASLFPRSPVLAERRLVAVAQAPYPPPVRLTITPPVIRAAERIAVLVTGSDKAAMVTRALTGPPAPEEVPVQLARHGTWFLDRAAAALLPPGRAM